MARVSDLTSLLTATGVAIGRANGSLTLANVPTLLQTCNVVVNLPATVCVPDSLETLLLDSDGMTLQLAAALNASTSASGSANLATSGPAISISATYMAVPSLVPVPPT